MELVIFENPEFGVGISTLSVKSSTDVIISGFQSHIDISGCRSVLYSLANIIFHLYVVLNLRFVVVLYIT